MKNTPFVLKALIVLTLIFVFAVTDAQAGPDCEIVSLQLEDVGYFPHTIYFRLTIENVGDARQAGATAALYLSRDTTITPDDIQVTNFGDVCPNPGGTVTFRSGKVFQEGGFPAGEYYLGAIVSCSGDTNSANDTRCTSNTVSFDGSDLTIESMQFGGFTPSESGGEVSVDYCVKNVGLQDSIHYYVNFYASKDATITESDHYIDGISGGGGGLSPGEAHCQRERLEFSDLPSGNYHVGAIVWCLTDFNPNASKVLCSGETFSIRPLPDLSVRDVQAESGLYRPGDTINVEEVVVANTGYGLADSYTIDYYASSDDDIDPGDYHIGSRSGSPLDRGDEKTFVKSCRFPDDIPEGDYYIGVIVTCEDDIDLDNNKGVDRGNSVSVGASADLAVQSVQVTPGVYMPDQTFVVYSLIENIDRSDSDRYTVDCYASKDATITRDDFHMGYVDRAGLEPGEKDSYETTYRIPFSVPAGQYYIGLIVASKDEYNASNNVGRSAATIELVHPSGYLCGHVQYVQSEYYSNPKQAYLNRTFPVRYSLVQVFEHDNNDNSLDDRLVGQTHTDPNGNYALTLSNDEPREYGVYVKVFAEGASGAYPETTSKICILKDDVFKETYSLVSPVYPHPQDASVVINLTAPSVVKGDGEFMVFDSLVEGFCRARSFFDVELKEVTAYWPSEEGTSYFDPCDMGIYISQGDRRDRDVIMHEYGHYVAHTYGVGLGPVGDNSEHYWDRDLRDEPVSRTGEHAMNLAFREAWASVFSIATQFGDSTYPRSGDSKYMDVDEESNWTLTVDLDNEGGAEFSPGQYFENMNAGALWDIFDDKNDGVNGGDTLSDPLLSKIWSILLGYKPENIMDFWDSWFHEYDHEAEMKYIFEAHEMPFVTPKR